MGFITKLNLTTECYFGSQMSQYASMVGISKKVGLEPIMIREYLQTGFGYFLDKPFIHKPKVMSVADLNDLIFKKLSADDIKIDNYESRLNANGNYIVDDDMGMFHYFDSIKDEILNMYSFNEEILSFSTEYLNSIKTHDDEILVSICFRRGDYLTQSSLNLSLNYYYDAISLLETLIPNQKIKFLVFSGAAYGDNGMAWVKENFKTDKDCCYIENLDMYRQMCIMTLCDHMIIANSSFPWWAAYLNKNKNKNVICPFKYVNDSRFNHLINGKYFPKDWISIESV